MFVSILMGSISDWAAVKPAKKVLEEIGVPHSISVLSAHRTPDDLRTHVLGNGEIVYICAAGMAAHLAGAVAALTICPVIALPISGSLLGLDALLSSVQMPKGVPVATVAINGAENAGILAVQIWALKEPDLMKRLGVYRSRRQAEFRKQAAEFQSVNAGPT